jgi:solute carrier family 66, member 2
MTVFPPLASLPQLLLIREKKSLGSFSIFVPAILLVANILRVFFWLTVGFAFNLLLQSLLMIVMQVLPPLLSWSCSRSALKYPTIGSSTTPTGSNSGSGRPTNSTVALLLVS